MFGKPFPYSAKPFLAGKHLGFSSKNSVSFSNEDSIRENSVEFNNFRTIRKYACLFLFAKYCSKMVNFIDQAYAAKKAKQSGGYKLKSFANDLAKIGREMEKPKGFSLSSVSTLMNVDDVRLCKHRDFEKIKAVVKRYCEENQILFDKNGSATISSRAGDKMKLDGVWLHYMLDSRSESKGGETSNKVRRSILVFRGDQFTLIGPTTLWSGNVTTLDGFLYYDATESGRHEKAFGIFKRPYPKRLPHEVSLQHGVYLGVALSIYDDPGFPIGATRSVMRRLDELSSGIGSGDVSEECTLRLRGLFCGYFDVPSLLDEDIPWDEYKELSSDEQVASEHRYTVKSIVEGLIAPSTIFGSGARIIVK